MADSPIYSLTEATSFGATDLFVLEQNNEAKKLPGQVFINYLVANANGHGGINNIALTGSTGTQAEGTTDTYTITYADTTTSTFTVKNGAKGDKGDTGATGATGANLTIRTVDISYVGQAPGDFDGNPPSVGWSSSVPATIPSGGYLWIRTEKTYSDGTQTFEYLYTKQGTDGTGAVNSVNGYVGTVVLTAADVGALANTYVAPVTSVNGYTGTVTISASDVGASTVKQTSISLSATWTGAGPYTQTVTVTGGTANSKVDIQPDATALAQLISDGVAALYIVNNSATFTAYAVGAKPTASLTVQATITEVVA